MALPCPACGFVTVPEDMFGTFHICDVCGWEDDAAQLANPACGGGANHESLIEAQARVLAALPLGRPAPDGRRRDAAWRPLSEDEVAVARDERAERHWRNKAVLDRAEAYWARRGS